MNLETAMLADSPLVLCKLNDPSGTTAADLSGNGYDGIIHGSPSLAQAGGLFTAMLLDGANDYVEIPDPDHVFAGTALTVEIWFRTASSALASIFAKYNTAATNTKWNLRHCLTAHKTNFLMDRGSGTLNRVTTASTDDDTWHQVVGAYDGVDNYLYLDGALADSGAGGSGSILADTQGAQPLTIGSYDGTFEFFTGYVAYAAMFPSVLSAGRVLAHWDARIPTNDADALHSRLHIAHADSTTPRAHALHSRVHLLSPTHLIDRSLDDFYLGLAPDPPDDLLGTQAPAMMLTLPRYYP